jgi:O-antigen/teichoic acid export membrane protein
VANHQQSPALAGSDRLRRCRECVGECPVGSGRKRRSGGGTPLHDVRILDAVAIALVIGVVFAATFRLIPWQAVFHVSDAASIHELKVTCALVLGLLVLNLPLSLLRSLYNAHQDGYFANVWWILSGIASLLGLVVVTRFRGGLPQLVIAVSGVPTLLLLANACYTFGRRYPWLTPTPSAVKWRCTRRLLKLGVKYMTMQLASLGIYQSQAMLITQTLGPSQVVVFVVAFKIMNLPSELVYMGTAPLISAFGEAKARRDWGWIKGAYKNGTFAAIVLGMPLAAALGLSARPLILIWAGSSAVPDPYLILWLSIHTAVGVSFLTVAQLLCAIERVGPLVLCNVFCALGCIGFGVIFAQWWGLNGIAFAMSLSVLVTLCPIGVYEVRRFFRAVDVAASAERATKGVLFR